MTFREPTGRPASSGKLAPVTEDRPYVSAFDWLAIVDQIRFRELGEATNGVAGRTIKGLAYRLAWFADLDNGTRVFPGPARLAVICETDYKTVKKVFSVLRNLGLLTRVGHGSGPRGVREFDADQYRLTIPADLLDRVHILDPSQLDKEIGRVREANRRKVTGKADPRNADELRGSDAPVTDGESDGVTGKSDPGADELRGNPVRSYGGLPSAIPTSDLTTERDTDHDHPLELPLTPREGLASEDPFPDRPQQHDYELGRNTGMDRCGQCDAKRQVELPDGRVARCPRCHPLAQPLPGAGDGR